MDIKIPKDLNEAIVVIGELQARVNMIDGHSNLLLAFLTENTESRQAFFDFAKKIANAEGTKENEDLQRVARIFCPKQPPTTSNPPFGDKPSPLSNVFQFPKK